LCKLKYEDAIKAASAHCKKRLEDALGQGHKDYLALEAEHAAAARKGADEFKKWFTEKGVAAYQAWIRKYPGHLDEPIARYRLGKAYNAVEQYEDARKELAYVRDNFDRSSSVSDDAAYHHALSYELGGDTAAAEREFGAFLRDYSWTSYAKEVAKKYKAAGPESSPVEGGSEE
jgi:hypothetical protein